MSNLDPAPGGGVLKGPRGTPTSSKIILLIGLFIINQHKSTVLGGILIFGPPPRYLMLACCSTPWLGRIAQGLEARGPSFYVFHTARSIPTATTMKFLQAGEDAARSTVGGMTLSECAPVFQHE